MGNKKVPLRKCIVCSNQFEKNELIRIVKNKDNEIYIDYTFKANGRGSYICKNEYCINKIKKIKALDRAFKSKIDADLYDKIVLEIRSVE